MTQQLIVLIEDSERYISELLDLIKQGLHIEEERVRVIRTESEFYNLLPALEREPPALFIVDIMLPYKAVGEADDSVPSTVRQKAADHKFYRAGIRCANWLLANSTLHEIPILLHSILEKDDMASDPNYPIPSAKNVTFYKKEANGHGIIQAAEQILSGSTR